MSGRDSATQTIDLRSNLMAQSSKTIQDPPTVLFIYLLILFYLHGLRRGCETGAGVWSS